MRILQVRDTGNYNATTARFYTDTGLFTVDPEIGEDASELQRLVQGHGRTTLIVVGIVVVVALLAISGAFDSRWGNGGIWPLAEWHEAFESMHSGKIAKAVLKP